MSKPQSITLPQLLREIESVQRTCPNPRVGQMWRVHRLDLAALNRAFPEDIVPDTRVDYIFDGEHWHPDKPVLVKSIHDA